MVATDAMKKNGFTLMELLIAISIVAILMAIGIVSYGTINKQSRDTRRKSDLEQIRSALEMYRADKGYYPNAGGGSFTEISSGLAADLVTGGYIAALPTDPKSGSMIYEYQALNRSADDNNYYGYCLSAQLESETPTSTPCTPDSASGHNYATKNP